MNKQSMMQVPVIPIEFAGLDEGLEKLREFIRLSGEVHPMRLPMDDYLFTVEEVKEILQTSPSTVYSLINKGHLKALKLGRLKIRKKELERFLESIDGMDFTDLDDVKELGV